LTGWFSIQMISKNNKAVCIAVFGSGSEVGKSVTSAALCRIFSNMGIKVAPFKAQNMSNNSFVTPEGGEIGRAQAVQAQCARVEPHVDMNPLLLKPSGNNSSQIVLHGKAVGTATSMEFREDRGKLFQKTAESLERLRAQYDLVVIEGAGSCAEVNLRDYDLANFRTSLSCSATVFLVADISRGGVFAQILGTLDLLKPEEREQVKGIIVNRFRGDISLFTDGIKFIEEKTGLPVLGVVPHFESFTIASEDSVALETMTDPEKILKEGRINISVLRFPHISNFTDFEPFSKEEQVNLTYISRPRALEGLDMLILPGSKNTRQDLTWMADNGWDMYIKRYVDSGGRVLGICGGYQVLGRSVEDPHGVEGEPGFSFGLGLLDVRTVFDKDKKLARVTAKTVKGGHKITAYEIHMGITQRGIETTPFATVLNDGGTEHEDGAVSEDGMVFGTYLHGLFDETEFRNALLESLGGDLAKWRTAGAGNDPGRAAKSGDEYALLAEHFRKHLDLGKILKITGLNAVISRQNS
jgi:adenosylcobyric acid synthase